MNGTLDLSTGFSGLATINVRGHNSCGTGGISEGLPILIFSIPGTPSTPQGDASVNSDTVLSSLYTIPQVPGATGYSWHLDPAGITGAGTISGSDTAGTVLWNHSWVGTASVSVNSLDSCGVSIPSEPKTVNVFSSSAIIENPDRDIRVYPNPATGQLNISFLQNISSYVTLRIMNTLGTDVYRSEFAITTYELNKTIDLAHLSNGIYFLQIENKNGILYRGSVLIHK